ncbi:hypothetical protein FOPE_10685 [Fonsecaea pedrosoi]|nr:hypothetical protein FOPE_10685 [Fonsecaea pedrosoi]
MPIRQRLISLIVRARLWLGKKRFGFLGPTVIRVSKNRIIKGPCEVGELEGLEYVAQHTSIPVPKVYQTYRIDEKLYIEMEYVHGDTLQAVWNGNAFSADEKQALVNQVSNYIEQLRGLEPPQNGIVASPKLGQCFDVRLGYRPFGPFSSTEEFHSFLRGNIPLETCSEVFGEAVTRCHSRQYRISFSHADICPRNLIVHNRKLVVVIDWQFAGWYPEYWEYTKAHYTYANADWWARFEQAVTRYDDELAAERALWRQLEESGMLYN